MPTLKSKSEPKISRRKNKDTIKIRVEINEMETRRTIQRNRKEKT
jgi:hypothetical protein